MLHYKKFIVALTLAAFMIVGMAATRPSSAPDKTTSDADGPPKRNLKVLPKDISHDDLDRIMDSWKIALGVKCNFCHAADTATHRMDFASDAKPEKDIARHMFRMTGKINKKYFSFNKNDNGVVTPAISCMTCHHGSPHPDEK